MRAHDVPETIFVMLTSAIAFGGVPRRSGTILEVDSKFATNLFQRGRARLPTEEELAAHLSDLLPAAGDPQEEPVALYGSSVLPPVVKIGGKELQLGDIVRGAFEVSTLTAEEWNAMPEADRETALAAYVDKLKADDKAAKAAAKAAK